MNILVWGFMEWIPAFAGMTTLSVLFESQRNTRRQEAGGTQLYELTYKGIKPKSTPQRGRESE